MAYNLERKKRNYILLERSSTVGNFFSKYPRHNKLISINKVYTGSKNREFNLRHDWNSLLNEENFNLGSLTDEFFPSRKSYLKYLQSFANNFKLNVKTNTEIGNITKVLVEENNNMNDGEFDERDDMNRKYIINNNKTDNFRLVDVNQGTIYGCRILLIATGIDKPVKVGFIGEEYVVDYSDISTDENVYKGKNVLILGHGNSAFETAQAIYKKTSRVHILGRSRVRLAWETHYVGDLRSVNNELIDTYQLKSLDGILEGNINDLKLVKEGDKFFFRVDDLPKSLDNFPLREGYHMVIRCTGFQFDDRLFSEKNKPSRTKSGKYPLIDAAYQSVDIKNLYFIGAISHSLDYRKSSGGFIHGFRYTVKAMHSILERKQHGVPWPSKLYNINELINVIVKRINEVSSLYQMHGVLGDVITFHKKKMQFRHITDFPIQLLPEFEKTTGYCLDDAFIVLTLNYGAAFSKPGNDVLGPNRARGYVDEAHLSNFLHPQFYYYERMPNETEFGNRRYKTNIYLPKANRVHHILEDFHTIWLSPISHVLPLRRFLENCVGMDLRKYPLNECVLFRFLYTTVPVGCLSYGVFKFDETVFEL